MLQSAVNHSVLHLPVLSPPLLVQSLSPASSSPALLVLYSTTFQLTDSASYSGLSQQAVHSLAKSMVHSAHACGFGFGCGLGFLAGAM